VLVALVISLFSFLVYTEFMDSESRRCLQCELPYRWKKSTSRYLKFQFCSDYCEKIENGGSIDDFLAIERFGFPMNELVGRYANEQAGLVTV
jgi:hypothetical protein